ncbi:MULTISPECIES: hypothetical protein [unclassified Akkermansia]|nr:MULTISPECIES: hypothetical protein [unclassified Akkermansia]
MTIHTAPAAIRRAAIHLKTVFIFSGNFCWDNSTCREVTHLFNAFYFTGIAFRAVGAG